MQLKGDSMKLIRRGCNSEIYLVEEKGKEIAIKAIQNHFIKQAKHLLNEWNILKTITHPNIIKAYRWNSAVTFTNNSNYNVLAQEYAQHGSLLQYMKTHNLTLKQKISIMKDVFNAINYLHSNFIVHRDLKLDNILIFQQDKIILSKIADFGFASRIKHQQDKFSTYKGTRRGYMAPEIHRCIQNPASSYQAIPIDVFSIGVALFALILQKLPFEYAIQDNPVYKFIFEGKFQQFWNLHRASLEKLKQKQQNFKMQQFCSLIQSLICFQSTKRLSMKEALEHPFFKEQQ